MTGITSIQESYVTILQLPLLLLIYRKASGVYALLLASFETEEWSLVSKG